MSDECPDETPYRTPSYSTPDAGYELYELSLPRERDPLSVFALAKAEIQGKV